MNDTGYPAWNFSLRPTFLLNHSGLGYKITGVIRLLYTSPCQFYVPQLSILVVWHFHILYEGFGSTHYLNVTFPTLGNWHAFAHENVILIKWHADFEPFPFIARFFWECSLFSEEKHLSNCLAGEKNLCPLVEVHCVPTMQKNDDEC